VAINSLREIFKMRKVLLATTALVAMSVTGAQADINISGSVSFEMADDGTATTYVDDSNLMITGGRTMDNGVTATVAMNITGGAAAAVAEDTYIDLSGDFGSVRMGDTDDALDRMDGVSPQNWDNESIAQAGTSHNIGDDLDAGISFISQNFNGATVYGAANAEGEQTGMGVNYTAGPVEVMYQMGEDGGSDETMVAAAITVQGLRVGFGQSDVQAAGAGAKTKYRAMGAQYSMGAAKLTATSQKLVGGDTYSNVGVAYTVAPGMTVVLESGSQGSGATAVSGTYAHLNVTF
jgi:hypothetical protein